MVEPCGYTMVEPYPKTCFYHG